MAAPFFTILWQSEQAIDALFPGVSRGIVFKGLYFRQRWCQTSEIKGGTAQQLTARSRRIRFQTKCLTLHFEKFINGMSKPSHLRNGRALHRLVRPMRLGFVVDGGHFRMRIMHLVQNIGIFWRPWSTTLDPIGDQSDFLIAEFILGRHLQIFVVIRNDL